jgi:tripartite-type tricarboxylate transporter receptor subunit TctC
VPAATPAPVVRRLHDEALKALATPEVRERMANLGADAFTMAPESFNAYIRTEMESAARIARTASLKAQ